MSQIRSHLGHFFWLSKCANNRCKLNLKCEIISKRMWIVSLSVGKQEDSWFCFGIITAICVLKIPNIDLFCCIVRSSYIRLLRGFRTIMISYFTLNIRTLIIKTILTCYRSPGDTDVCGMLEKRLLQRLLRPPRPPHNQLSVCLSWRLNP